MAKDTKYVKLKKEYETQAEELRQETDRANKLDVDLSKLRRHYLNHLQGPIAKRVNSMTEIVDGMGCSYDGLTGALEILLRARGDLCAASGITGVDIDDLPLLKLIDSMKGKLNEKVRKKCS